MSSTSLKYYHLLPPWGRSAVATTRGFVLRQWRYGPETDDLVASAVERESWSSECWKQWQEERLALILHRAATTVPYYETLWADRRRRGDRSSWEVLSNWPVLDKELLRAAPRAFVSRDRSTRTMMPEQTSGTTGKPVMIWKSRSTLRSLYAIAEVRERNWNDVSRNDRWAMCGGQLVVPVKQARPPFWVWNAAMNQLYASSYHISSSTAPAYGEALRRYDIVYLWGYSSSLYALGEALLRRGNEPVPLRVAITNAEPVEPHQRETIRKAFLCPLRETYGMSENVIAASECSEGTLHLWPEIGHLEVLDENGMAPTGTVGEFICTGLLNEDMPLIRYRVGDRGALRSMASGCSCGRSLPSLAFVEGRNDDVLLTKDGRRIGRLDPVFKQDIPLRGAQVEQTGLDQIVLRYVPGEGFDSRHARQLADGLRERLGDVGVELQEVAELPRTPAGKFRAVICSLPRDVRKKYGLESGRQFEPDDNT
jgi:phenylacetate-CoA ligase